MTLTTAYTGPLVPVLWLETAACLWEAVLEIETYATAPIDSRCSPTDREVGEQIAATREAIGSSELRSTVTGWCAAVNSAWELVDRDAENPGGGAYTGGSFDWDFCPAFIMQNVDWSTPNNPHLYPNPLPLHGPAAAPRSPLDELAPDLRKWLVDDMGFEPEMMGGGAFGLRRAGPEGSSVLVTCSGGGGLPDADCWHVGAYGAQWDDDAMLNLTSDDDAKAGVTLEMAVGAAVGMLADYNAPTPPPVEMAHPLPLDTMLAYRALSTSLADMLEGGEPLDRAALVAQLEELGRLDPIA